MMDNLKAAWAARSPREQWMLGAMFALLAIIFLWLGVARPVERAWTDARAAMLAAADTNAAIRAKVKMLKELPASATARDATPMEQLVGQSAAEAGLTLERAEAQGGDRMDIAMASVRPVALFGWLAALESQGIRVETMNARPAPTAGSVAVQAVLAR